MADAVVTTWENNPLVLYPVEVTVGREGVDNEFPQRNGVRFVMSVEEARRLADRLNRQADIIDKARGAAGPAR